jgi:hypothetical protein
MIRLLKRENALERQRLRALAAGELKDVTPNARELGIAENVCISKRLWISLVRPYPFAEPHDCLSLSALLRTLKQRIHIPNSDTAGMVLLLPPDVPDWFRSPCYLRFLITSSKEGRSSIVIRPLSEQFNRCAEHRQDSLPATLLARLGETIRNLMFVTPPAEQGLVDSMRKLVDQMIESNPFHREIVAHLAAIAPNPSLPFPLGEYCSVLLADLDELLAILVECTDVRATPTVEALKSHYRALLSPLAAFRHIVEQLLQFTAAVSGQFTLQTQAFAQMLKIHADIHARLHQLQTEVPKDALAVVRFYSRMLTPLVATPDVPFLADIERACASLLANRWSHSAHGPSRECRHAVVWH